MRGIAQGNTVKSNLENEYTLFSAYMHKWECAVKPIANTVLYIACFPYGDVDVTLEIDPHCKSPSAAYNG